MSRPVQQVEQGQEFEFVEPVRLSKISFRAFTVRVERKGSAFHSVMERVCLVADLDPEPTKPVDEIAAVEARRRCLEVGSRSSRRPCVQQVDTRRVVNVENEETQNFAEELEDRLPKMVNAEEVHRGDKIQDEGWPKTVMKVVISKDDVLIHFESNPYGLVATYQYGHPATVYRLIEEMGDDV